MATNTLIKQNHQPQARDFWTDQLGRCRHQRLREALTFRPPGASERVAAVRSTPQPEVRPPRKVVSPSKRAIAVGLLSEFKVRLFLWKEEFVSFGRVVTSFAWGVLCFLTFRQV